MEVVDMDVGVDALDTIERLPVHRDITLGTPIPGKLLMTRGVAQT